MPETNCDRSSGTSNPLLAADLRNQYKNPALASIVRDRRIQVLPVQWRASLQLDQEDSQEDVEHGMDNRFTMADITINKSSESMLDQSRFRCGASADSQFHTCAN
jgi:hypothetical protein